MATRDRHYLEIVIDSSKARRQMRNMDRNLGLLRKSAQGVERAFRRLNSVFALAIGGTVITNAIKDLVTLSDTMIQMESRVGLVAEKTVGLEKAMSDLTDISLRTFTSLEATGASYAKLGMAAEDLNLTHQEIVDTLEALQLSLRISGATAKEASSVMVQFAQMMGTGKAAGDEMRAVMEGGVRVTKAWRDELKMTTGQLREFGKEEGSAAVLAEALRNQLGTLREENERIGVTIGRTWENVRTAFAILVRDMEKGTGIFGDIAEAFSLIASKLVEWNRAQEDLRKADLQRQFFAAQNQVTLLSGQLSLLNDEYDESLQLVKDTNKEYRASVVIDEQRIRVTQSLYEWRKKLQEIDAQLRPPRRIAAPSPSIPAPSAPTPTPTGAGREPRSNIVQQTLAQDSAIWDAWLEQQIRVQQSIELSTSGMEEYVREMEELGRATTDSVDPNAAIVREMESLDKQLRANVITMDVYMEKQLQLAEQMEQNLGGAAEEQTEKLDSLSVAIGNTMANAVDRLGDTMVDFAFGAKTSFSDMANSILKDIAAMMVKFALMRIMFGGQTPGAAGNQGGLLSFLFNARGNAFSGGNVVPFAKGGVVNRPTMFPMADGGVGIMGERSPEAVMPLMRDSKGRLGVSGGGTVVNIHNNSGQEVEQSITNGPDGSEIVDIVIGQVDARIMAGGTTARALETAYGVRRAGYNR